MEEKIQVLIEHFDRSSREYELGKQEVVSLSLDELETLLNEIPISERNQISPARVITKEIIIVRIEENLCSYKFNYQGRFELWSKIFSRRDHTFNIDEFARNFENLKKEIDRKIRQKKRSNVLDVICFNLISFLIIPYIIISIMKFMATNIYSALLLIWALTIIVINLCYSLFHITHQIRPVEYSFPIKGDFETVDVSGVVNYFGQFFIFSIVTIIIYNENPQRIIEFYRFIVFYLIFIGIVFSVCSGRDYYKNKKRRKSVIQFLYGFIQEEENLSWDKKHYFFHLITEVENKKIIKFGFFPQLIVSLSYISSLIPFFLYIF